MDPIDKRRESAEKHAVWLRNYQRARGRALTRLTKEYPDRYRELFQEERAKDEAEGKAWVSIHGRTSVRAGSAGHTPLESTEDTRSEQAGNNTSEARDLG